MKILKNKWVKAVILFATLALVALWITGAVILKKENARKLKEIKKEAVKFKQLQEMARTDTYGGKTPQETLQMFIDAVEAGDYELASKYFVVEKGEGEKLKLINIDKQKKIKIYVDILRQSKPWRSSLDEDDFVMKSETDFGGPLFIYFIKYSSNIWKINEI